MKLLVISGAFPPMASGEAANTFHLCKRLAAAGVDVHVLTSQCESIQPLPGVTIEPRMEGWSWRQAPKLIRHLRACAPDAILLIYLGGIYDYHPMITFVPTIAKRVLARVRVVTRFENPKSATRWKGGAGRIMASVAGRWPGRARVDPGFGWLLRDSDRVIVLCEHHRAILQRHDPTVDQKATLIPPPPNVPVVEDSDGRLRARGRERIGVTEAELLIGYLGYVYRNKGIETLLRAMSRLKDKKRNVRLAVIGGQVEVAGLNGGRVPYFEQMKQLARELAVAEKVTWTGAFSAVGEEVASYIHAADLFVLPFDSGIHLNNSSFAAIASYGRPVITTRREHTDDAFVHGENVLLCEPENDRALSDAVETIMDDPDAHKALGPGARALAREWFSWEKAVERTMATLHATG